ncbi:MAG: glycine--tRNA ligase subunit beta [Deltaproteobacteria bacterium]|nr:glycine--tRNA ligase subunit beta [Deltaproteobacteria bacterium]
MTAELLLEIGTEEIPSDYLENGLRALKRLVESQLRDERILIEEDLEIYGTPRRLVLIGRSVADKQKDIVQEVTGPPKKAAFDREGNPTKAAIGFAEKQGVSVDAFKFVETPRGEYVSIEKKVTGRPTSHILSEATPGLIRSVPWPKSMRWGDVGFSFVRPIHWVLALLDGQVIPFEVGGVKSGNISRGHRFMGPKTLEIRGLEDYLQKMKKGFVIINMNEREKEVIGSVVRAAETVSGTPTMDPELLSTVTNLVEFPSAVCGGFDHTFLSLPEPVLITAMKKHQKYFALRDSVGQLLPHFVAVNNTLTRDEAVVRKGHERVLAARLSDANFFFKEDRKRPLEDRLEDLKEVIYQARLGTSYAKIQRCIHLAEYLAERILPQKIDDVRCAARLCKCDLVTDMVGEFPVLQGVMGREYARLDGYPEEVCLAIHEHYLPLRAGDELPTSPVGCIVGIADRMDTISGFFAIGLEPTGAADPFALRRHALAIIRILEEMQWDISFKKLVEISLKNLRQEVEFVEDSVAQKVSVFFRERYKSMALRSGYESDLIDAVLSANFDYIHQLRSRIDQLKRFMVESEEFEALALTFKRITNILKKQDKPLAVNVSLLREPCEQRLWEVYEILKGDIHRLSGQKAYFEALNLITQLRQPVDELFDEVAILAEDPQLRDNRVAMLQDLAHLFLSLADFSKFSI